MRQMIIAVCIIFGIVFVTSAYPAVNDPYLQGVLDGISLEDHYNLGKSNQSEADLYNEQAARLNAYMRTIQFYSFTFPTNHTAMNDRDYLPAILWDNNIPIFSEQPALTNKPVHKIDGERVTYRTNDINSLPDHVANNSDNFPNGGEYLPFV